MKISSSKTPASNAQTTEHQLASLKKKQTENQNNISNNREKSPALNLIS